MGCLLRLCSNKSSKSKDNKDQNQNKVIHFTNQKKENVSDSRDMLNSNKNNCQINNNNNKCLNNNYINNDLITDSIDGKNSKNSNNSDKKQKMKEKQEEIQKKEKELKEKEKLLNDKEKEFDIKENKLIEREKEFNSQRENLNNRENKIILKENELEKLKTALEEKEKNLKEKESNINLQKSKLEEKENKIKIKEDEMSKLLKKYKQENEEIKKLNLELRKDPILVGLNNIGATCYMNATLQSLSNSDKLTEYFLKNYKYEPNNNKKIMSNVYYNVIKDLWNRGNNNKSFSPNEFKEKLSQENPLFAGIAANDSKDLINFLIERIHNELNVTKNENGMQSNNNNYEVTQNDQLDEQKMLNIFINEFKLKYNSIISDLFYGLLETKSQCQQCKYIKYNFQVYSFIEFPLERVNQYCFMTGKRNNYNMYMNNNKNPDVDLYECFEYYNNLELMTGDNQMYCNICNCNCDSLYGSLLYSAPNYLIINLNRGRGAVYECKVIFPEQLNLFNYVSFKNGNTVYELYAVICHIGPSSMSGHFVAYCRNRIDKKWYLYNDAFVNLCQSPNEYQKGMAYILFYQVLSSS